MSGLYLPCLRHECPLLITRMYAGLADSENRIKELKEDLSLDTFCLRSCYATDAAVRMCCVL